MRLSSLKILCKLRIRSWLTSICRNVSFTGWEGFKDWDCLTNIHQSFIDVETLKFFSRLNQVLFPILYSFVVIRSLCSSFLRSKTRLWTLTIVLLRQRLVLRLILWLWLLNRIRLNYEGRVRLLVSWLRLLVRGLSRRLSTEVGIYWLLISILLWSPFALILHWVCVVLVLWDI